jgi:preprotein translocase subunit SecF
MRITEIGAALYRGQVSYDFIGKRRRWYAISAIFIVLALFGLFGRGFNLGIEFEGGAAFTVPNTTATVEQARTSAVAAGVEDPIVTEVGNNGLRVQTPALTVQESRQVTAQLSKDLGVPEADIGAQVVGPSWGAEITKKALQGLIVFLVLLMIFLTLYFEWKMAVAAIVALVHDIVITVGIYVLTGIEVTPATVIGVLTILGFSMYDTVVVFDKVRENTHGIASSNKWTYSEAANLALNQTLVRSINTSVVALLPIAAILVIGVGVLGAGTLKDLSLALFVGTIAGTYSSIFIATPLLVELKEREPAMKALSARVAARKSGLESKAAGRSASGKTAAGTSAEGTAASRPGSATAVLDPEQPGDEPVDDGASPTVAAGPVAVPKPARAVPTGPRRQPSKSRSKKKRKR